MADEGLIESPVRTARNKETGETVKFKWHGAADPTPEEIGKIFEAKKSQDFKEKQQKTGAPAPVAPKPSFSERMATVHPLSSYGNVVKAVGKTMMEKTGLNPIESGKQVYQGGKQIITGENQPGEHYDDPRIAGAGKALGGGLGLLGTVSSVLYPETMGSKKALVGLVTGAGAQKLTEKLLPESWKPEVRELLSGIAGVSAGMAAGHFTPGGKAPAAKIAPSTIEPIEGKPVGPMDTHGPRAPLTDEEFMRRQAAEEEKHPLRQRVHRPAPGPVTRTPLSDVEYAKRMAAETEKHPLRPTQLRPDMVSPAERQPLTDEEFAARQQAEQEKHPLRSVGPVIPPEIPGRTPLSEEEFSRREQADAEKHPLRPTAPNAVSPVVSRPPLTEEEYNQRLAQEAEKHPLRDRPVAPVVDNPGRAPLTDEEFQQRLDAEAEKHIPLSPEAKIPPVMRDKDGKVVNSKELVKSVETKDVPQKEVKRAQRKIVPHSSSLVKQMDSLVKDQKAVTPVEASAEVQDPFHVDPYKIPDDGKRSTPAGPDLKAEPKAPTKLKVSDEAAETERVQRQFDKILDNYKSTTKPENLAAQVAKHNETLKLSADELKSELQSAGWEDEHIDTAVQKAFPDKLGYKKPGISEKRKRGSRGSISLKSSASANNPNPSTSSNPAEMSLMDQYVRNAPEFKPRATDNPNPAMRLVHEMSPMDQYLSDIPEFKSHVDNVKKIHYEDVMPFKYEQGERFNKIMEGFDKSKNKDLMNYLRGVATTDPQVKATGDQIKPMLTDLYNMMKEKGHTSPDPVNYINDLASHMGSDKTFGQSIRSSFDKFLGNKGDDPIAVMRKMIDHTADIVYKREPYLAAKAEIAKMPDSFNKEMGNFYWDNFTGTAPRGSESLTTLGKIASTITHGTSLGLSSGLQLLHAMRVFTQGMPEIGAKWVMKGFGEAISNRKSSYERAVRSGLVSNYVPKNLRSKGETYSNIISLGDFGNNMAKTVMLEANRAKLKAVGDPNWELNAVKETARQEGMADATSPIKILKDMNPIFSQYKGYTLRYGYQVLKPLIAGMAQRDKAQLLKAAKLIGYGIAAYEIGDQSGLKTFHFHPAISLSTNTAKTAKQLWVHASKGDIENVVIDLVKQAPAGQRTIKRDSQGDVSFHPENLIDVTNRPLSDILRDQ